jgi:DNA primase
MRFPPQFLDELRARLPVSDVVGRRVKLRKAGREWKGLSPFNKEKSPSFFVNDQKGFYHDFSSGKHGDIFGFVMESEGVGFAEAVERLASLAGLPLPAVSPQASAQEAHRKTLHEVMQLAAKFFETSLAARTGAKARGYLADRGIAPATQLKFRIGYAPPERFALKEHLGKEGVPVEDMVETGLLVAGDDIPVPYDRFRDRVMFPITDIRGRVIAFGGRALEKDVAAKYLNSPETPLFHKGATLYNIATARAAAHQGAPVIAVEGYVDVIAMVTAGFEATVAPLGTALTEDQLALLWKLNDEPVLCFDGDGAGQRAAYRAVDIALPLLRPGKSLKFALLPQGQDPDDLMRSGGREAIAEVVAGARPLAQMLWTRETEAGGFDTPERRAALETRIGEISNAIRDEMVRKYYRQDLTTRVRQLFAPVQAQGGYNNSFKPGARPGARNPRGQRAGGGRPAPEMLERGRPYAVMSPHLATGPLHRGHRTAIPRREALILQSVINHPWLLHDHLEELAAIEFRHSEVQRLKEALIDIVMHDSAAERDAVQAELLGRGFADVITRMRRAVTTVAVWGIGPEAAVNDVVMTWKQLIGLHHQWNSLTRELKDAEHALGQDSNEANYAWLRDVKARLSAIEGTEAMIEGFGASSGRPSRSL